MSKIKAIVTLTIENWDNKNMTRKEAKEFIDDRLNDAFNLCDIALVESSMFITSLNKTKN